MQAVSGIVFGTLLLLVLRGGASLLTVAGKGRKLLIISLPLSLFALHGAVTVLGRMNMRPGPEALCLNSYYAYLPLLGLLIALYGVCAWAGSGAPRRGKSAVVLIHLVLMVGLVILSIFSGWKVHAINVAVREEMRPLIDVTRTIQRFIDRHQHEPGFSIAFDHTIYALGLRQCHALPPPLVLFKRSLNNHHPQYLLTLKEGTLVARRQDGGSADSKCRRSQVYPDLLKVGTAWNIYYFEGWYYGISLSDGFFCPDRKDCPGPMRNRTLQGAEIQARRAWQ
jgi:hypothetical protein